DAVQRLANLVLDPRQEGVAHHGTRRTRGTVETAERVESADESIVCTDEVRDVALDGRGVACKREIRAAAGIGTEQVEGHAAQSIGDRVAGAGIRNARNREARV